MDGSDGITHVGVALAAFLLILPTVASLGFTAYTDLMIAGLVAIIWLAVWGCRHSRP